MHTFVLRIYDLHRIEWLLVFSVATMLLIGTPLADISNLNPYVMVPALLLQLFGIYWFYYKVCSLKTKWQLEPEGFSIKALQSVKR